MVFVGGFVLLVSGRCDYLCCVTVQVHEAFGEICRVLIWIFYDGDSKVFVVLSYWWENGIQVTYDFIRELLRRLEYISGSDVLHIGNKGRDSRFGILVQRSQSDPCGKQVDEPISLVVSYFGKFFPLYFHHVVQAVSPAIGTNDVRSCGEMRTSALLPV